VYMDRESTRERVVDGHVEIRWSHGKFAQPPEAKVYVDTPADELPGYYPLWPDAPGQIPLFSPARAGA
jgi:hypothetical protein